MWCERGVSEQHDTPLLFLLVPFISTLRPLPPLLHSPVSSITCLPLLSLIHLPRPKPATLKSNGETKITILLSAIPLTVSHSQSVPRYQNCKTALLKEHDVSLSSNMQKKTWYPKENGSKKARPKRSKITERRMTQIECSRESSCYKTHFWMAETRFERTDLHPVRPPLNKWT